MSLHEVRCETCATPDIADSVSYHYIVVRSDLPPGVAAAMVAHAAAGSAAGLHDYETHVVVLQADERQLMNLSLLLQAETDEHGFGVYDVVETSGRYEGELLALGVEPGPRLHRKDYFAHLGLYGA